LKTKYYQSTSKIKKDDIICITSIVFYKQNFKKKLNNSRNYVIKEHISRNTVDSSRRKLQRINQISIKSLNTLDIIKRILASQLIDKFRIGFDFNIRVYRATNGKDDSMPAEPYNTEVEIQTDKLQNEWILGGGGFADWTGAGNLLTAMYPSAGPVNYWEEPKIEDRWFDENEYGKKWHVSCKSHIDDQEFGKVHAYCMTAIVPKTEQGLPGIIYKRLPEDPEYGVTSRADHLQKFVKLPLDYKLIGGGARAEPYKESGGGGTMLSTSRPKLEVADTGVIFEGWEASAHVIGTPGRGGKLAVWAIGIHKEILAKYGLRVVHLSAISYPPAWVQAAYCRIEEPFSAIVSGGAECILQSGHSQSTFTLTASYPDNFVTYPTLFSKDNHDWRNWVARAKSHGEESYDFVKAWGLALVDDKKSIPSQDPGPTQQPSPQDPP
jgi:hypothetical protein